MNGYIYQLLAVSLQTILSNWLGPAWWSLASLRMLLAWLEANAGHQTARFSEEAKTISADSVSFNGVTGKKTLSSSNIKIQTHSNNDNGLDD